jgi:hypothetical protein
LFRLGRFRSRGGGRFASGGIDGFAGFADGAEGFADGDLGAGGSEDFQKDTIEEALELHGGFIGFNFGEHGAGFDGFAFFFEPFDQRAHRHGVAEFGHFDDLSHGERKCRIMNEEL